MRELKVAIGQEGLGLTSGLGGHFFRTQERTEAYFIRADRHMLRAEQPVGATLGQQTAFELDGEAQVEFRRAQTDLQMFGRNIDTRFVPSRPSERAEILGEGFDMFH